MTNLTIFSKGSLGVDFVTKKQRGGKLAAASHVAAMTRGKVAGKECSFRNDVAERIRKKGCVLARASAGKLATWAGCPHAPRSQVCSRRLTWCCAAAEQATRQAFKMKPARSAPLRSCSMQQARAVKMQRCNVRQGGQGGWLEDATKSDAVTRHEAAAAFYCAR